jgi:hypothetical protein
VERKRSALVGGTLVVAVSVAGCFGSGHRSAAPSTDAAPPASMQALPPPSTVATFAGQAKTCPRPKSYVPRLSPTDGSAGTRAIITGTLPLYGENGKLDASVTTKLVGWWNLVFIVALTCVQRISSSSRPRLRGAVAALRRSLRHGWLRLVDPGGGLHQPLTPRVGVAPHLGETAQFFLAPTPGRSFVEGRVELGRLHPRHVGLDPPLAEPRRHIQDSHKSSLPAAGAPGRAEGGAHRSLWLGDSADCGGSGSGLWGDAAPGDRPGLRGSLVAAQVVRVLQQIEHDGPGHPRRDEQTSGARPSRCSRTRPLALQQRHPPLRPARRQRSPPTRCPAPSSACSQHTKPQRTRIDDTGSRHRLRPGQHWGAGHHPDAQRRSVKTTAPPDACRRRSPYDPALNPSPSRHVTTNRRISGTTNSYPVHPPATTTT